MNSHRNSPELIQAGYKTVEIFSNIVGKRLLLRDYEGQPHTDGITISVPFDYEYFYESIEHELSHILFESDGNARVKLINSTMDSIMSLVTITGPKVEAVFLRALIIEIVGLLEDRRVSSLWGQIYPGSYVAYKRATLEMTKSLRVDPQKSVMSLFLYVETGLPIPAGPLDKFIPIFELALKSVELKGFDVTIILSKWLIKNLLGQLCRESTREAIRTRAEARSALLKSLGEKEAPLSEEARRLISDVRTFEDEEGPGNVAPKLIFGKKDEDINKVLKLEINSETDIQDILNKSGSHKKMRSIISNTVSKLEEVSRIEDLTNKFEAKVLFSTISRHEDTSSDNSLITILKLKTLLKRIHTKKVTELDFSGHEVDTEAFIERVTSGSTAVPVFRHDTGVIGFKGILLIDRSGSMDGYKTEQVQKACYILRRAMKLGAVSLELWGYNSLQAGVVSIYKFEGDVVTTGASRVDGATPTHIAIRLALEELYKHKGNRQLFVMTDGLPQFRRPDGSIVGSGGMMNEISNAVKTARQDRIAVTGLMLKDEGIRDQEQAMTRMFGHSKFWKELSEDRLEDDLVDVVISSLQQHLGRL